jgi:hypothetical protein
MSTKKSSGDEGEIAVAAEAAATAPVHEVDRRTVEAWGEAEGHPPGTPGYWKFSAAQPFLKGWSPGALVTRIELKAAMAKQLEQVTR